MLKIKDVYKIAGIVRPLTEWVLRERWFPEAASALSLLGTPALEAMQAEGRLQVRELVNPYIDGYRIAQMHTLWLDGHPVLIVQDAGRGGDDHHKRWVTDGPRYFEMLAYLLSKLAVENEAHDITDPEAEVYEETVFSFYGKDFGEQFGYKAEPRTKGYCLMPHALHIVPGCDATWVLALLDASVAEPAAYIRRGDCVLALERHLNAEELASNPAMTPFLKSGQPARYVWYRPSARPAGAAVLSV